MTNLFKALSALLLVPRPGLVEFAVILEIQTSRLTANVAADRFTIEVAH